MKTITERERQLINAVTAEGLTSLPAGVLEKDLLITVALRGLAAASTPGFPLVFCGGTCLSKAHGLTGRMSEYLDFKVQVPATLSRSARDRKLSQFKKNLIAHFHAARFDVPAEHVIARDGNRHFSLMLRYASVFPRVVSLRPEIQVDVTDRPVALATQALPLRSLLEAASGVTEPAIEMTCIGIEETLAEKALALLRRIAESSAGRQRGEYEPRLVRHLYDMHQITRKHPAIAARVPAAFFSELVKADARQFRNQHPEFAANPRKEMARALAGLKTGPRYRADYANFLDQLVYGEAVNFDAALAAFERVAAKLLAKISSG